MRIYYFGINNANGGLENFAKNLITEVSSLDDTVKFTILAISDMFSYRDELIKLGCEIIRITDPYKNPVKFYYELKNVLKKAPKDSIVQLNVCSFRNELLFRACKKSKLKTIVVGHYTKVDDGLLPVLHKINTRKYSKKFVCVSNSDDVTNFMFPYCNKVKFINNGVSQDRFKFSEEDRNKIRNEYGLNTFVIGQIGRICDTKNQLFSIKVVENLNKRGFECQLVLVGKEYDETPKEYVKCNNIKNVEFLGPIYNDLEKFYSAFDVCLLPSKNEGMSLSLLESASNGVDAIFSAAVPRLSIYCPNLTYLELDENLWANKIIEISNKGEKERVSSLIGTIYDLKECARSYISLYYDVYNGL